MKGTVVSLVAGVIFAIGLVVSGMVDPYRVTGFLDIFGDWDPSLIFVMGGAVGFNLIAFKVLGRSKPAFADRHYLPTRKDLDKRLIGGAALFGIGWGLLGVCPGPGVVNLVTLNSNAFLFVGTMLLGMFIYSQTLGKSRA